MADTGRTLAALQALLADNTAGAISPQDLRDALVSCLGCYGEMYVTGGSTAQTGIGTAAVDITAFTTAGASEQTTVDVVTGDTITVTVGGVYLLVLTGSYTGTVSTTFTVYVAVNGVNVGAGSVSLLDAAGAGGHAAVQALATLAAADEVTGTIKANGASKSATITEASLQVIRIG